MMYSESVCDGVRILRIDDENFDAKVSAELRRSWIPLLKSSDVVVIDCELVEFIDSSAIGTLLSGQHVVGCDSICLASVGERLSLCLTRVAEASRLTEFDSVAAAVDVLAVSGINESSTIPQMESNTAVS